MTPLAANTRAGCPFCPEQVNRVTPRFAPEFLQDFDAAGSSAIDGRLQRGEATLFPNLFPYDDISAIAVMSQAHTLPSPLPTAVVADAVKLARDFFAHCLRRELAGSRQLRLADLELPAGCRRLATAPAHAGRVERTSRQPAGARTGRRGCVSAAAWTLLRRRSAGGRARRPALAGGGRCGGVAGAVCADRRHGRCAGAVSRQEPADRSVGC